MSDDMIQNLLCRITFLEDEHKAIKEKIKKLEDKPKNNQTSPINKIKGNVKSADLSQIKVKK